MSPGRLKRCDVETAIEEYDQLVDALNDIGPYFIRDTARLLGMKDDSFPDEVMKQLKKRLGESSAPTA